MFKVNNKDTRTLPSQNSETHSNSSSALIGRLLGLSISNNNDNALWRRHRTQMLTQEKLYQSFLT